MRQKTERKEGFLTGKKGHPTPSRKEGSGIPLPMIQETLPKGTGRSGKGQDKIRKMSGYDPEKEL
jgi:hypothetical protein